MRYLSDQLQSAKPDLRIFREERSSLFERSSLRDMKLSQMLSMAEQTKNLNERSESAWLELQARNSFLEGQIQQLQRDLNSVQGKVAGIAQVEDKFSLVKAELNSQMERNSRQHRQDLEIVQSQVNQVNIFRDELIRMKEMMRLYQASSLPPPIVVPEFIPFSTSIEEKSNQDPGDPSSKQQPDNRRGIPDSRRESVEKDLPPTATISSLLKGFDNSGAPIWIWKVFEMDKRVYNSDSYPRMVMSDPFPLAPIEYPGLTGRLKLFPLGSDQCRKEGYCSLYLRCPAGVKANFSLLVAGATLETFECNYDQEKDKGRNEFCRTLDFLASDGSLEFGIAIHRIRR